MVQQWKPESTIKSKLLPIEIATNDYWELSDDESPMVIDGKKCYFTYDEAVGIKVDGWRLPTRAEWARLCAEFGGRDGGINPNVLGKALKLKKNGAVTSSSRWVAGYSGSYWSSTAYSSTNYAYNLNFTSSDVYPSSNSYRYFGFSVRLVRDVKE